MNNGFYPNLDINFEQAYDLCNREFTHLELLQLLEHGNIPQKQIAALKFDKVENKRDAIALLNNLTGCDGKIREAAAFKINQILNKNTIAQQIYSELAGEIFAQATIDINGNICRLILESACCLKIYPFFTERYTAKILEYAQEALIELDKFIFRDKKYVINKQLFKLYWCLETLKVFYAYVPISKMIDILLKCAEQKEYTIREKTAQIAILSPTFQVIKDKLQNDKNYYVQNALNNILITH